MGNAACCFQARHVASTAGGVGGVGLRQPTACAASSQTHLTQDFFKPKNIIIRLKEDEKWGAPQREALYRVRACGPRAGSVTAPPRWPASAAAHGAAAAAGLNAARRGAAPGTLLSEPCPVAGTAPPACCAAQGLERYGVGKWREMIHAFPELSRWAAAPCSAAEEEGLQGGLQDGWQECRAQAAALRAAGDAQLPPLRFFKACPLPAPPSPPQIQGHGCAGARGAPAGLAVPGAPRGLARRPRRCGRPARAAPADCGWVGALRPC